MGGGCLADTLQLCDHHVNTILDPSGEFNWGEFL